MTVNCPSCNEQIEIPSGTPVPPPPPRMSSTVQQQNPLCRTCGQGALIKRTKFRMSGPVVAIGFILLIPSVLGMLFGVFMLFVTGAANSGISAADERQIRAHLAEQGVPALIIDEVVSGKPVSDDQLVLLTSEQRTTVHTAESSRLGQKIGGGAATVIFDGFSIFIIVA
jgi:hypothetical protein